MAEGEADLRAYRNYKSGSRVTSSTPDSVVNDYFTTSAVGKPGHWATVKEFLTVQRSEAPHTTTEESSVDHLKEGK